MPERRYLLMTRVHAEDALSMWAAIKVEGVGRLLTRDQAEAAARQLESPHRFLLPESPGQTDPFSRDESPNQMGMLAGETIWTWGEPLRLDLNAVLRSVVANPEKEGEAYEASDPDLFPVPVEATVNRALQRFGQADRHDVEHVFDQHVMQLGGKRYGSPPCYHVPMTALGL
jgi:hypothetical protein